MNKFLVLTAIFISASCLHSMEQPEQLTQYKTLLEKERLEKEIKTLILGHEFQKKEVEIGFFDDASVSKEIKLVLTEKIERYVDLLKKDSKKEQ